MITSRYSQKNWKIPLKVVAAFSVCSLIFALFFTWLTLLPDLDKFWYWHNDKLRFERITYWIAFSCTQFAGLAGGYILSRRKNWIDAPPSRQGVIAALLLLLNAPALSLFSLLMGIRFDLMILLLWPAFLLVFSVAQCLFAGRLRQVFQVLPLNFGAGILALLIMVRIQPYLESRLCDGLFWMLVQVLLACASGLWLAWQNYSKRCHSPS